MFNFKFFYFLFMHIHCQLSVFSSLTVDFDVPHELIASEIHVLHVLVFITMYFFPFQAVSYLSYYLFPVLVPQSQFGTQLQECLSLSGSGYCDKYKRELVYRALKNSAANVVLLKSIHSSEIHTFFKMNRWTIQVTSTYQQHLLRLTVNWISSFLN